MESVNMLKQLLEKFQNDEAMIHEERTLITDQISQLESRLEECLRKQQTITGDRTRVTAMMERYLNGNFIPPPEIAEQIRISNEALLAATAAPTNGTSNPVTPIFKTETPKAEPPKVELPKPEPPKPEPPKPEPPKVELPKPEPTPAPEPVAPEPAKVEAPVEPVAAEAWPAETPEAPAAEPAQPKPGISAVPARRKNKGGAAAQSEPAAIAPPEVPQPVAPTEQPVIPALPPAAPVPEVSYEEPQPLQQYDWNTPAQNIEQAGAPANWYQDVAWNQPTQDSNLTDWTAPAQDPPAATNEDQTVTTPGAVQGDAVSEAASELSGTVDLGEPAEEADNETVKNINDALRSLFKL